MVKSQNVDCFVFNSKRKIKLGFKIRRFLEFQFAHFPICKQDKNMKTKQETSNKRQDHENETRTNKKKAKT